MLQQQRHNNGVTTTASHQQCNNNGVTTTVSQQQRYNNSGTSTASQLIICDFSGETFKGFDALEFSMSATTTQLLSSGEYCKLRYDTIPVNSASADVSFYTNNSRMTNFELWHSCCKWALCLFSQENNWILCIYACLRATGPMLIKPRNLSLSSNCSII